MSHSGTVSTFGCHGQGGNQFFELNSKDELRYTSQFELCISIKSGTKDKVGAVDCSDDSQTVPSTAKWKTIQNQSTSTFQLKNRSNGLCLAGSGYTYILCKLHICNTCPTGSKVEKQRGGGNPDLQFEACKADSRYQNWFFKD